MWLWLIGVVVLIVFGMWLGRWLTADKARGLVAKVKSKVTGLSPLTGNWSSMKDWIGGVGGAFLFSAEEEEEGEYTPPAKKSTPRVNSSSLQWDFSSFTGTGKRERIVKYILETLHDGKVFESVRPDWLRNPNTGRCLEIDHYNEELGLAVETSGKQHFSFEGNGFHTTREEFLKQVWRDRYKKDVILERGLDFFVVPYTIPIPEIPSYIGKCLKDLGRL